jgi:uncharacterized membrane protein
MKGLAVLVGVIFIIVSTLLIKNDYLRWQIQQNGTIVKMRIIEIPSVCSGTKAKYFYESKL